MVEDDNLIYNIEVNKSFNEETIMRNYIYQIYYLIIMVKKGKKYKDSIKPVVQVNYNLSTPKNFDYNGKFKDMETDKFKEYVFLKEIINIDIAKYMHEWYNLNKSQDYYQKYKHFLILGMSKEDLLELEDDDVMVKKIKNEIFKLNDPSEFPRLFSDEEFLEIEKNNSFDSGLEEGVKSEKIENARKMKSEKLPLDLIGRVTGLDAKVIATL